MEKKAVRIQRTPDPGLLLKNKLYIDGIAYPGDVIVGYAEKHSPLRWIDVADILQTHAKLNEEVSKTEDSYIPCHPPLLCSNIVALKRKNGKYIIIAGSIAPHTRKVKAHVLHERELYKGKMYDTYLLVAKQMESVAGGEISSLSEMAANVLKAQKAQLAEFDDL